MIALVNLKIRPFYLSPQSKLKCDGVCGLQRQARGDRIVSPATMLRLFRVTIVPRHKKFSLVLKFRRIVAGPLDPYIGPSSNTMRHLEPRNWVMDQYLDQVEPVVGFGQRDAVFASKMHCV